GRGAEETILLAAVVQHEQTLRAGGEGRRVHRSQDRRGCQPARCDAGGVRAAQRVGGRGRGDTSEPEAPRIGPREPEAGLRLRRARPAPPSPV
ncbi:MAG: hypothetical protein AVDCRST_MAG22-1189, partial [uncultured Rubrobacteraceae bacterium]